MIVITGVNALDEFIIKNSEKGYNILLYFGANWCGPCKQLKNKLEDLDTKKEMPNLVVAYIDVDDEENNNLVNRYKVESLPTQIFIKLDKNKVIPHSRIEGYDFNKLKLEYDNY